MGDFDDPTTYDDTGIEDTGYDDPSVYDEPAVHDPALDPPGLASGSELDLDGDGTVDTLVHDLDRDGMIDAAEYDTDGDGITDTFEFDQDGDGMTDTALFGDGTGARYVVADTDGDGVADTAAADYDGDGTIDESVTLADAADGTGLDDLDGSFEPDDPDGPAADISGDVDHGPFVTDDLPDADDDGIHGDPRADIEYHQTQPGPVDCLPTSVAMAISEATGSPVDASEVVDLANAHGFMTESGMSIEGAATLFEEYGMDAEVGTGTVDDLRAALDAGDPVIVGIDAADLYSGDGGPFDQGMVSGHAVVITGIDDGPPGVVYINDPGFPDGAGLEIPLDQFEDAWQDSDHALVTATGGGDVGRVGDDGSVDAGPVDGLDGLDDDGGVFEAVRKVLFLPLNFEVVR